MMRYNTTVQTAIDNMDPVLYKIGIDNNGYIAVWYWDDGRSNDWILTARRGSATAASDYRLVVKLWDQNSTLVETPVIHLLEPSAPELIYNYIESPDGVFNYPLFSSAEQAEWIDSGDAYQLITFPDDTVPGRVWYAPVTDYTNDGTAAPTDTSEVTWNNVPTQDDDLFAPSPFSSSGFTFDEGAAINIQLVPSDATFTTTVSISPALAGVNLVGANLEGTAPEVTGDNVANPSDTYTVAVTRTNTYGSSTGTFDLIINNLTAPTTALAGFTHVAGTTALVDSDTLDDGSAVTLDDTLQSIRRFIIPQAWIETYVLPAVTAASGNTAWLGIKAAAGDLTDGIADSDFDGFISWQYQSSTSHRMRLADGFVLNVGIGSTTDALYDYAIEVDGTDVHFIACNVNNIMNEPSVNNGGSFSHVRTISGYTGTLPATLTLAVDGMQMDFSDTYLAEVEVNLPPRWIQVTGQPTNTLNFDGSTTMPTLNAGYTYRFLMADVEHKDGTTSTGLHVDDDLRFTADGATEYTTGITRVGNPNDAGAYVEFAVPADVPAIEWYTDHNGVGSATAVTTSGSTANAITTSWTKALDFSGSSERLLQVANSNIYSPIMMDGVTSTVVGGTAGSTSNDTNSRPWHTAVVFSSDNHNSDQYIWCQGEGTANGEDNIYLRVDSSRNLYFGWGRNSSRNECSLGTLASGSGNWYGIYVASTGERLSGGNASAANLADCFEIYGVNLQTGVVGSQMSIAANWTTTGGRMDRTITGDFTVGGLGATKTFHGKVASMVVSTLRRNQVLPTTAEVSMMVTDPVQWMTDYKIGANYRRPANSGNESGFQLNSSFSSQSTQVWLMGDGTNDAYAQIRNQVFPTLQSQTPLNMVSMTSNDIETVNISGLT